MECKLKLYRQCEVNGKKALFHKWEDKCDPVCKANAEEMGLEDALEFIKFFKDNHSTIAPVTDIDTVSFKETLAIVEYEDGSLDEVEPSKVKFLDSNQKFSEYIWEKSE